jgi:ribosome-associated translation inhibitor RaiA
LANNVLDEAVNDLKSTRILQSIWRRIAMQLSISARNMDLADSTKATVERHLRFGLTRFSPSIRDTACTISDESGPRGAPARRCQVVVRFRTGGQVIVEAQDNSIAAASSSAADRAARAVTRHLDRKRQARKFQRRRAAQVGASL